MSVPTRLTAGCLCGAVRLVLDRPPLRVGLCHCATCRKETGGPFKHFAVFARDAVRITGRTRAWAAPGGQPRHFCPICGARLFADGPDPAEIEVNAGCVDRMDALPPAYEGFAGQRAAWLPGLGLTCYAGNRET